MQITLECFQWLVAKQKMDLFTSRRGSMWHPPPLSVLPQGGVVSSPPCPSGVLQQHCPVCTPLQTPSPCPHPQPCPCAHALTLIDPLSGSLVIYSIQPSQAKPSLPFLTSSFLAVISVFISGWRSFLLTSKKQPNNCPFVICHVLIGQTLLSTCCLLVLGLGRWVTPRLQPQGAPIVVSGDGLLNRERQNLLVSVLLGPE